MKVNFFIRNPVQSSKSIFTRTKIHVWHVRKWTVQDVLWECSRTEAFWKEVIMALKGQWWDCGTPVCGFWKKKIYLKTKEDKSSRKMWAAKLIVDTWKNVSLFSLFLNRSFCNLASVQSIRKHILISVSAVCTPQSQPANLK